MWLGVASRVVMMAKGQSLAGSVGVPVQWQARQRANVVGGGLMFQSVGSARPCNGRYATERRSGWCFGAPFGEAQ